MLAMFSIALFGSATALVADTKTTLDNYSDCLVNYSLENLDLKTTNADFRKGVRTTCETEKKAMIEQAIKDEMGFDSSREEATQFANEEAEAMVSRAINDYVDYLQSGRRPAKPK